MAEEYNIGTTVKQEQLASAPPVDPAELPTCLIGPLYQVVENEEVDSKLNPLGSDQTFTWPSLKTGATVDLKGVKNGRIDSQLKRFADFPPTYQVVIDGIEKSDLDDDAVNAIDGNGFTVDPLKARVGTQRDTLTMHVVYVNDEAFLYKYDGGLSVAESGDYMKLSTGDATVDTSTDTRIYLDTGSLPGFSTSVTPFSGVDVTPAGTPGRVNVSGAAGDYSAVSIGDAAVTGYALSSDFKNVTGTIDAIGATISLTGLNFGANIDTASVQDYIVKLEVDTDDNVGGTGYEETYFCQLNSIDTAAQTMVLEDDYTGNPIGGGAAVATDDVRVTIYRSQIGYVESKNSDDSQMTVVVPTTISETDAFVNTFQTTEGNIDVFPSLGVEVTYRAGRNDLADTVYEAGDKTEFQAATDASDFHYQDELGYAVQVVQESQPNDRQVMFIPIDTSIAEDAAYDNALLVAETVEAYNVICMSDVAESALESHVTAQSNDVEKHWRRGFFTIDMPEGETESVSGEILPGQTSQGTAASDTDGNKVIRDANVQFATGAGVAAGTKVVVTSPSEFEGEYTAKGTTTDNDLILEGNPWAITREFEVAEMDVETVNGVHQFREDAGGAVTIEDDYFTHVEPGDYVEADIDFGGGSETYRLRVTNVLSNGKGFDAVDEVPGDLTAGAATATTDVSVIRSWGYDSGDDGTVDYLPAVEYHIDPLTKSDKVDELINRKSQNDRRFTTCIAQAPTVQVGTDAVGNPIRKQISPFVTLAAIAAKRSGLQAHDPVTNLFLGGGIEACEYADSYFQGSQLNELAAEGFCLVVQSSSSSEPKIRDMITSATGTGLVNTEEMVVSNLDWQAKTLVNTYSLPDGTPPPRRNGRLSGRRVMNLDSLIKKWIKEEDRLRKGSVVKSVEEDPNNARKTNITYLAVAPTAEKEVEIIQQQTV